MKIEREHNKVKFKIVGIAQVFTFENAVYMKTETVELHNAVSLGSGRLVRFEDDTPVQIVDHVLTIK